MEKQGSEGEMNETAFRAPVMGRAWLDEVLHPSSLYHSQPCWVGALAVGRSEGCFPLSSLCHSLVTQSPSLEVATKHPAE